MPDSRPGRRAVLAGLGAAALLGGCGMPASVVAPQAELDRVRYRHPGPPLISLVTVRNNGSNNGAHTGLIINASERVIFDPAGSFAHPAIPERNDVLFGITPQVEAAYITYQASNGFHAVRQDIAVSAEAAELAFRLALAHGPAPKATCTRATSGILRQLPGFGAIPVVWLPENLMERVQRLPGVTAELIYQDDDDLILSARAAFDRLTGAESGQ